MLVSSQNEGKENTSPALRFSSFTALKAQGKTPS